MGNRRLLDLDPASGVQTWHDYDHDSRETTIQVVQDAEPYLRINKARMNADVGGARGLNDTSRKQIKESWWHVASVPVGVQYKWLAEEGINMTTREGLERATKKLNDPEWAYLRTNPGRI